MAWNFKGSLLLFVFSAKVFLWTQLLISGAVKMQKPWLCFIWVVMKNDFQAFGSSVKWRAAAWKWMMNENYATKGPSKATASERKIETLRGRWSNEDLWSRKKERKQINLFLFFSFITAAGTKFPLSWMKNETLPIYQLDFQCPYFGWCGLETPDSGERMETESCNIRLIWS